MLLEYMNISVQNEVFLLFLFIYIFHYFQTDDFVWTISYVCKSSKPLTINKSMYLYACTTCPTLLSPLNPLKLDITEHFRS